MLWPLLLATVVYAITAIPYALAYVRTPPGMIFGGTLAWSDDQDVYFSFIRQAADGHFLFVNRLTCLEHGPAFFNLEWLLVGRVMAWLHGSTDWAYHIWRAAGALVMVCGFAALTEVVLHGPLIRRIALLMCVFGGTFQTLCFALNWLSRTAEKLTGVHAGLLSTEFPYFTTHPFAQILVNPHFAVPLGLFMLAIASYMQGELTGGWRWYLISGAMAVTEGLMRPYEMIVLYTAIPLFILVELLVVRRIEWRKLFLRTLPLMVVAPVFVYTIFIFQVHPIFKYWASQGVDLPISIPRTLAHMGLAGLLLAIRLCFAKKYPLKTSIERLLLVWMLTTLFFIHANAIPLLRFMPYTPQIMTSLMPPVILLGVVVLDPAQWSWGAHRTVFGNILLFGLLGLNALDSAALLRRQSPSGNARDLKHYIPSTEIEAYEWIDQQASEDDVVLCLGKTGHRLAKYASVRVVSGHWSVTPQAKEMERRAERFYRGAMPPGEAVEFLQQCRVTWIYVGRNERWSGEPDMDQIPGFTKRVVNEDVTVYSARP